MRCIAYSTAQGYNLPALYEALQGRYHVLLQKDLLYLQSTGSHKGGEAFFFSYGALVFWTMPPEEEKELLQLLLRFEEGLLNHVERDVFEYSYGANAKVKVDEETIVLPDGHMLTKLAVSHGLAQSVKLGSFEYLLQATYNEMRQIPEELSRHGSISFSRSELRKKMGYLFNVSSSINLGLDLLDSPDFFWEHPELEPLYNRVISGEELHKRVDVINKRLAILHELLGMLGNELNHQHSSRLEWIIICLIVIEVLLTIFHDVVRIL